MSHTSLTIVCLAQDTATDQLASTAASRLASTTLTSLGSAGHFIAKTRWHRGSLLQPWKDTAAGGPVRLLDLDAMRVAAHRVYWYRWHIWNQVVAGTRPALPYWTFLDRHCDAPSKYPLAKAQRQYLAQPRIATMLTYNALPNRLMALPTSHLEAFQAGVHGYAHYGWLGAVPGNSFLCLDGTHLVAVSDQYATEVAYLADANHRITALHSRDALVALCTR
ncbi:hypothetical protein Ais01nite_73920 [Asanoa ishikariensis]|uniref:Uncharacterized protein n=1 Tax=Asanoa ishikariensis TaxID=137265 RepID=A0A1H3UT91_9ACTN|nr:hypothetical protein [Asanoa ishikariensis]GIF69357.1 hypothetical protein Ais01nite_73920 [Asanoa ishikariensis]SDZ65065.1 hypothetical protein SAMN05421684_7916 [Asanoa ishikariensis]